MATGTRVQVNVDGYEYWSTWWRKEAETYGRGCPADVSQYVETSASGTCVSSRRMVFDAIVDDRRQCSATRVACCVCLVGSYKFGQFRWLVG
jgi:hypothetical protein